MKKEAGFRSSFQAFKIGLRGRDCERETFYGRVLQTCTWSSFVSDRQQMIYHLNFFGNWRNVLKYGWPAYLSVRLQHSATEETCYLVVLDAQKIGQDGAVVCRLRVPKQFSFPMGFHSSWEDSAQAIQLRLARAEAKIGPSAPWQGQ